MAGRSNPSTLPKLVDQENQHTLVAPSFWGISKSLDHGSRLCHQRHPRPTVSPGLIGTTMVSLLHADGILHRLAATTNGAVCVDAQRRKEWTLKTRLSMWLWCQWSTILIFVDLLFIGAIWLITLHDSQHLVFDKNHTLKNVMSPQNG